MNYLAHLHLASHCDSSLTGNLLGDFIKGPLPSGLEPSLDAGIWLHRRVDAFTDAHPEHRAAVGCFAPPWRRFGAILVDMLYDHWLSLHWAHFSPAPLPLFLQQSYAALLADEARLPGGLPLPLTAMVRQNWLASYAELDGLTRALNGIGQRLRRPQPLGLALATLLPAQWHACEQGFLAFYPDLMRFTQQEWQARPHFPDINRP
ncbi:ACP phosphodiesterase [Aeromonas molluscorum]|uniref:acyl carrier protein phosphodiesterase n=1 Tax=Aeromonas molluscorum TaxID=271417 RepID=UPI003F1A5FFB